MNIYVKMFLHRGLIFSGLGPIVAGIIYLILEASGTKLNLSGFDVFLAILTTYIMAFVQAGSSVFNAIEKWGKAKSLLCQMSSIYVIYIIGYSINHWIPFRLDVILIFTISFVTMYLAVWFTVYLITKKESKKLNEKLKFKQEEMKDIA